MPTGADERRRAVWAAPVTGPEGALQEGYGTVGQVLDALVAGSRRVEPIGAGADIGGEQAEADPVDVEERAGVGGEQAEADPVDVEERAGVGGDRLEPDPDSVQPKEAA